MFEFRSRMQHRQSGENREDCDVFPGRETDRNKSDQTANECSVYHIGDLTKPIAQAAPTRKVHEAQESYL
jgi:hypothetical protein